MQCLQVHNSQVDMSLHVTNHLNRLRMDAEYSSKHCAGRCCIARSIVKETIGLATSRAAVKPERSKAKATPAGVAATEAAAERRRP